MINKLDVDIKEDFLFSNNMLENILIINKIINEKINLSEDSYEDVYSFAYNFFESGQYQKALDIFKILVVSNHKKIKGFIALGACLLKLKKYESAVFVYSTAYIIDPNNAVILFNLGLSYYFQEIYDQSEASFLHAFYLGFLEKGSGQSKVYSMAEKLWKHSRSQQQKDAIEIENSFIYVD